MKIVTSGSPYIDIDGYAGCIGYAEFLRASGLEAKAVSTSIFNNSITPAIRSWTVQVDTTYKPGDDEFILIDMSSPEHLDKIVNPAKIITVIDHHPGFENYWQQKLGNGAVIETIGAACTLVYEAWENAGLLAKLTPAAAKAMACGILDNTLNFKAKITDQRDEKAYATLAKIAALPTDWAGRYFADCEHGLLEDLAQTINDDTKIIQFKTFGDSIAVGQIALWHDLDLVRRFDAQIRRNLLHFCPHWFINIINISKTNSHFLVSDDAVAQWLEDLLGGNSKSVGVDKMILTDRLWLRKEILQRDIEVSTARP